MMMLGSLCRESGGRSDRFWEAAQQSKRRGLSVMHILILEGANELDSNEV
jgi:hypothetical protein